MFCIPIVPLFRVWTRRMCLICVQKITDETHCDAFCVKTASKKKRKGVILQCTLNRTVLFILIWHYKLRVKSPKNFILWEKMWKVSSRTGKWKIQRKTFPPPPATSLQSKAEKCELKVFRKCCSRHGTWEGLVTYNNGGLS